MNCPGRTMTLAGVLLLLAAMLPATLASHPQAARKKDYLSDAEADKIRNADGNGERIVLFANFAADRIKKLQYEFAHMDRADNKRIERINSLIDGYSGCIDDAADLVDFGVEKQENITQGAKTLQERLGEFLPYLQNLAEKGPERQTYKDNLDDAIEGTQDAITSVAEAIKELAPPVRR